MSRQRNRRGVRRGRPTPGEGHEGQAGQSVQQPAGHAGAEHRQEQASGQLFEEREQGGADREHDVQRPDSSGQGRAGQEARTREVQQPKAVPVKKRYMINGRLHYCTQREADELMMRQAMGWPV